MLLRNWKKSSRPSKNVMLAAIVMIGVIAVYNWLVAPHRNYLLAAQKYESAAGNLARKNRIIAKNMKVKTKVLDRLRKELMQTRDGLFDPAEARMFFSDIPAFSQEAGCIVDSLEFLSADPDSDVGRPVKNNRLTTQNAKLSVLGSYSSIVALMNKLQQRAEQVRIDSVTVKPIRRGSSRLKCDMTIAINVIQNKEREPDD